MYREILLKRRDNSGLQRLSLKAYYHFLLRLYDYIPLIRRISPSCRSRRMFSEPFDGGVDYIVQLR